MGVDEATALLSRAQQADPGSVSVRYNLQLLDARRNPVGELDVRRDYGPPAGPGAPAHGDGRHLRLGLSRAGLFAFLQKIGFILYGAGGVGWDSTESRHLDNMGKWRYCPGYVRPETARWIESSGVAGPVGESARFGLANMTGYDVVAKIRAWLGEVGCEHLSVCEAVLLHEDLRALRHHVGPATVFWSHMQQEPFLGKFLSEDPDVQRLRGGGRRDANEHLTAKLRAGVEASTAGLLGEVFNCEATAWPFQSPEDLAACRGGRPVGARTRAAVNDAANSVPIWLDYTSLRQCAHDFRIPRMGGLFRGMRLIVCAPRWVEYLQRTFCVFELYLAVQGQRRLWVAQNFAASGAGMQEALKGVSVQGAQTRDAVGGSCGTFTQGFFAAFCERQLLGPFADVSPSARGSLQNQREIAGWFGLMVPGQIVVWVSSSSWLAGL